MPHIAFKNNGSIELTQTIYIVEVMFTIIIPSTIPFTVTVVITKVSILIFYK